MTKNPFSMSLAASSDIQGDIQRKSFEELEEPIRAHPDNDLVNITIDPAQGASVVLGSWGEVEVHEAEILRVTGMTAEEFARVPVLAYAVLYLNALAGFSTPAAGELPTLYEVAVPMRDVLVSNYVTLSKMGLVDAAPLKSLKGAVGYQNCAYDITAVVGGLRQNWSAIQGKCALTEQNLEQAAEVAARLYKGAGEKEHAPPTPSEASKLRQKAFTLLVRAWDVIRRGVTSARWTHGDADRIAPSMYVKGKGRGKSDLAPEQPEQPETEVPSAPAPAPATSAQSGVHAPVADEVPLGHFGAKPFAS